MADRVAEVVVSAKEVDRRTLVDVACRRVDVRDVSSRDVVAMMLLTRIVEVGRRVDVRLRELVDVASEVELTVIE